VIVILVLLPQVPIAIPGALMILFFGFFFGAVSARIVGIVGSSNTPVSGMTIAVMLLTTLILKAIGVSGTAGMVGAISVGAVVCIVMAISGDTSQDLKTGFLLGATPKKQQIGELLGVLAAAVAIGGIMILLNSAWGFGTPELAAPQATLMKMLVEGVMSGNLPWTLIFIGIFIAVVIEMLGIPVLPVAIGLYLPMELSVTIMIGGVIRWISDRRLKKQGQEEGGGILFCSGLIAGEGLVGILLAVLAVTGVDEKIDLSSKLNLSWPSGVALIALIAFATLWYCKGSRKNE
jgi:putative OPT family oligopeptide transporter